MSKHTPGPWAFKEGDAEKRAMSDVFKASDTEFRIGYVTCEWANPHQRIEDIANARLIAAAPDLLACLIEFVQTNDGEHTLEQYKRARAAIAKAEFS